MIARSLAAAALAAALSACACPKAAAPAAVAAAPGAQPTLPGASSAPTAPAAPSTPAGGIAALSPPAEPGTSRSALAGCLATTTEAEAAAFPPPAATRAMPTTASAVAVPGGALVTHDLTHACCLRGDVTTTVAGARVTVLERLSGSPCRCTCGSTLRTAVRLAPGRYTVAVQVESNGAVRTDAELSVEVR